jgi:hypothetical protein
MMDAANHARRELTPAQQRAHRLRLRHWPRRNKTRQRDLAPHRATLAQ